MGCTQAKSKKIDLKNGRKHELRISGSTNHTFKSSQQTTPSPNIQNKKKTISLFCEALEHDNDENNNNNLNDSILSNDPYEKDIRKNNNNQVIINNNN